MIAAVTGANGFVGSHLVERLVARGDDVRCLVRPGSDRSALAAVAGRARIVEGDLESAGPAVEGADAVFHVAGLTRKREQSRADLFRVNEGGTAALARACLERAPRLRRFVLLSTLAAPGPAPGAGPIEEDQPPRPLSDYGASKLAGERAALAHADRLPLAIVRPPGVYGPRDPNVAELISLVRRGFRPVGRRVVNFIHVSDLVEAMLLAAEHPGARGATLHAGGEDLTLSEVGRAVAGALGARAMPLPVPPALLYAAAAASTLLARIARRPARLHIQKARELAASWRVPSRRLRALGWAPRVRFEDGIAALLRPGALPPRSSRLSQT